MAAPAPRFGRGRELLLAAVALFLLLAAAYAFSVGIRATRGASITGDEPFYLLTTQSLLADGDLDLRNQYAARSYQSFFDHPNDLWQQSVPMGKAGIALLGVWTVAITAGLAQAGHAGEITIAVAPFDMAFPLFQAAARLFPLYTWWTAETWRLTVLWLAAAAASVSAVVWPQVVAAAKGMRRPSLPKRFTAQT